MGGYGRRNMVGRGCELMIDWLMHGVAVTQTATLLIDSLQDRDLTFMTIAVKTNAD